MPIAMADIPTSVAMLPSLLERIRGLERELRGETAEERHARLLVPAATGTSFVNTEPLSAAMFPTVAARLNHRGDTPRSSRSARGTDAGATSSIPRMGEGPVVAYTRPGVKVCNALAEPHSAPRWLTREEATRINEGEYTHLMSEISPILTGN
jgi:hypothetical protein